MKLLTGAVGKGWRFDPPDMAERSPAGIGRWIVEARWAHPVWPQYVFLLTALRPIEGVPEAAKYHPAATHELTILALDPEHPVEPETDLAEPIHYLQGPNIIGQFTAESDESAAAYVEMLARKVIAGELSPDTDFRRSWRTYLPFPHPDMN